MNSKLDYQKSTLSITPTKYIKSSYKYVQHSQIKINKQVLYRNKGYLL